MKTIYTVTRTVQSRIDPDNNPPVDIPFYSGEDIGKALAALVDCSLPLPDDAYIRVFGAAIRHETVAPTPEEWMAEQGAWFRWGDDWHVASHVEEFDAYDEEPNTCEYVVLANGQGDMLASLGCVDDATDEYRREVEADLLAEAMIEAGVLTR